MEIESCKVVEFFYCGTKMNFFVIEDVDLERNSSSKRPQLSWFIDAISELVQEPERRFFQNNDKGKNGATRLSKS